MGKQAKTLQDITQDLEGKMQCNCDLDNWQPERSTGHSWVCRIHKKALAVLSEAHQPETEGVG